VPRYSIINNPDTNLFLHSFNIGGTNFGGNGTNWFSNNTGAGTGSQWLYCLMADTKTNIAVCGYMQLAITNTGAPPSLDQITITSSSGTGWGVLQIRPGATSVAIYVHGQTNSSSNFGLVATVSQRTYFFILHRSPGVTQRTHLMIYDPANKFSLVGSNSVAIDPYKDAYEMLWNSGYIGDSDSPSSVNYSDIAVLYDPTQAELNAIVDNQIIPDGRRITWNPGVTGDIPVGQTVWTNLTLIDNTGGSDVSGAINATIAVCPSNQVIALPAGTFYCTSDITLNKPVTLRGAGRTNTTLKLDAHITVTSDLTTATNRVVIASGAVRDSTNLVTTTTNLSLLVGTYAWVDQTNATVTSFTNTNLDVCWDGWQGGSYVDSGVPQPASMQGGSNRVQGQWVKILTINNLSNITFSPSLYTDYTNAPSIFVPANRLGVYRGMEDMTITNSGAGSLDNHTILGTWLADCWWKNLRFYRSGSTTDGIFLEGNARCTVRSCDFLQSQSNWGKGVEVYGYSSDNLVEDCVFDQVGNPVHISYGASAGNVVAYNFFSTNTYGAAPPDTVHQCISIAINHGRHSMFNLIEGNICGYIRADFTHGSGSYNTIFRNWARGKDRAECTSGAVSVGIEGKNRYCNVVGNILGWPGIGTNGTTTIGYWLTMSNSYSYTGTWYGIRLAYPDGGDTGAGAMDWVTASNTLVQCNYEYATTNLQWNAAATSNSLPSSLYLASIPAWWSGPVWPPIDPTAVSLNQTNIPAGYRYSQLAQSGNSASTSTLNVSGTLRAGTVKGP
jgi:hypothetical protein